MVRFDGRRQGNPVTNDNGNYLERVAGLDAADRRALAARLRALTHGDDIPTRSAQRLVAFVVPAAGASLPDAATLRAFAGDRLPDYMVPQQVVIESALPRLPNGKLDRRALTVPVADAPDHEPGDGLVAPRNETERLLADIWCEVLGFDEISVTDNFFEVGGDSLLSIRILARAGKAGLRIEPERFFAEPTIAAQAAVAERSGAAAGQTGPVSGPAPLTPIQRWFFRRIPVEPAHWNQSIMLAVGEPLDVAQVRDVLGTLVTHHDALRLRVESHGTGWSQRVGPPGEAPELALVDLAGVPPDAIDARIDVVADSMHRSFAFDGSALVRFAWLTGSGRDKLLVVAHHLVVDAVSWRIVLEDLETSFARVLAGQQARLDSVPTPFSAYAEALAGAVESGRFAADLDYWRAPVDASAAALPVDHEATPDANTVATAANLRIMLTAGTTSALLKEVAQVYRTRIDEILLAALGLALAGWTARQSFLIDTEGHGRDVMPDDLDLSRTVGWLTTVYPVRLEIDPDRAIPDTVRAVKEQLRALPHRGASHGLLREMGDAATRAALAALPQPELLFNYLGQVDRLADPGALLETVRDTVGSARSPGGLRAYALEINAFVTGGCLVAAFSYSTALHARETIEVLARQFTSALEAIVDARGSDGADAFSPADFPLADLDQEDLDAIAAQLDDD